ncbi:winged helix-turn-helix transcriptional regulator [Streptomyces sp. NPDC006285]|uniref:winged helix-turn-helix transcriptional regulator n=1 Tax=Streptomyces sp. NPDC006285 TaxID=3364742 RepID=UPI0036AF9456
MTDHPEHCYELVADCPLRAATDLFGHTWDPVVLAALRTGPRRRRALRTAIGGISDKVLTDALRRLLAHGLIDRRAHAEAPPRVEYALTGLGRSLVEGPLTALGHWVTEHGDELLEAQGTGAGPAPLRGAGNRATGPHPPEHAATPRSPGGGATPRS